MRLEGRWERSAVWPAPYLTAKLSAKRPTGIELPVDFIIDTGADDVIVLAEVDIERLRGMGLDVDGLYPVDDIIKGIGGIVQGRALPNTILTFKTRHGEEAIPVPFVVILPGQPKGLPNLLGRSFTSQLALILDNQRDCVLLTDEPYTI